MTAFRVGQRVVCVDDVGAPSLKEGTVYTITEIINCLGHCRSRDVFSDFGVLLAEASPVIGVNFAPWRFRPIVSRPTSIAVFQAMLTGKKAGVEA